MTYVYVFGGWGVVVAVAGLCYCKTVQNDLRLRILGWGVVVTVAGLCYCKTVQNDLRLRIWGVGCCCCNHCWSVLL